MRINRYDDIVESAKAFGLDPSGLSDYLAIFKYGCPPHGGFAIGLERFTQKLLGLASVKEASLFPRDRKRRGRRFREDTLTGTADPAKKRAAESRIPLRV